MINDDDLISSIRAKKKAPSAPQEPTGASEDVLGDLESPDMTPEEWINAPTSPSEAEKLKARIKAILG